MTVDLPLLPFLVILFCLGSIVWRVLFEAKHLRLVERRVSELEEQVGQDDSHDPDSWKRK
jgi:hypothetical protein